MPELIEKLRINGVRVGTFYDKRDISDDGEIRMTGLTESIAVIAIDKHVNESKLLIIVATQVDRLKAVRSLQPSVFSLQPSA